MDWYRLTVDEVIDALVTDARQGLSEAEAQERLRRDGLNQLAEKPPTSLVSQIIEQIVNVLVLLLIGATIVAVVFNNDWKSAFWITLIVAGNAILGIWQDRSAESKMRALKRLTAPNARVVRSGKIVEIPANQVVVGDVIALSDGNIVPADARIIEAHNLQVLEAQLTGESVPVSKSASLISSQKAVGDRRNMAFMGTHVVYGRGMAVVVSTGMKTAIGQIARAINEVEEEDTPLQERMGQLAKGLVYGSLVMVVLSVVVGTILGADFRELMLTAVSMAVAIVPEALPAVITVTLALGAQRMVKRNALPRALKAAETLGSVTRACADKTGTLTTGQLSAVEIHAGDGLYAVSGVGYSVEGEVTKNGARLASPSRDLALLLQAAMIVNDASLDEEKGIIGDPTEGALLVMCEKAGLGIALRNATHRLYEVPFDSARKRMSVVVANEGAVKQSAEGGYLLFSKGAPEILLERCASALVDGAVVLVEEVRESVLATNTSLAKEGKRVLGFAYRVLSDAPAEGADEELESNLIWLGMTAMIDAPRASVITAVKQLRRAGVEVVMVTGDHPETALYIARQLKIATNERQRVVTGVELDEMSDEHLLGIVDSVAVFARVSPQHKQRIVFALQKAGHFVAMTGDGVNDAPALKKADIGVAMGITGTDVAKEAAGLILTDDNFATIVAATEEGRIIFNNVRKYLKYILGSNIGELIVLALAPLFGLRIPLIPVQILYMNLCTDGLPALALGVDPADTDVMADKPFAKGEGVFSRGMGSYIIRVGLVFGAMSVAFMLFANAIAPDVVMPDGSVQPGAWSSMVFTMLCLSQMGHALTCRSAEKSIFQLGLKTNPWLLRAVVVTSAIQVLLLYVPFVADFFNLQPLTLEQMLICLIASSALFIYVEVEKLILRRRKDDKTRREREAE